MDKNDIQSYHHFMNIHLFSHIDIDPNNIHIPDGEISLDQLESNCREYETKIISLGGIDFQLFGELEGQVILDLMSLARTTIQLQEWFI